MIDRTTVPRSNVETMGMFIPRIVRMKNITLNRNFFQVEQLLVLMDFVSNYVIRFVRAWVFVPLQTQKSLQIQQAGSASFFM
jgi:hypothetical protein